MTKTQENREGRWVTIKGHHIFIAEGESVETALSKLPGRTKTDRDSKEAPKVVSGPKGAKDYIARYIEAHPEIEKEAKKYRDVLQKVKNFEKENPGAPDGTYSATTGKMVADLPRYCVTFHQNLKENDPFGGYTDDDYAKMCAIAARELGSKDVYIGYFGNPEVSFSCNDKKKAIAFMKEHNQYSIYDSAAEREIKNPDYDRKHNPIKGR